MSAPSRSELEAAYRGKRVLVTGHTGFKGAWLTAWLHSLGAQVSGYALAPESPRWAFVAAGLEGRCRHRVADVRAPAAVDAALEEDAPDFIFHLAAQPLVRLSYQQPVETLATNVMGTAHLLDAVHRAGRPVKVVIVTSDKCYENQERAQGYREDEPMGGFDPYSMSKGVAELVVSSFRRSFFPLERLAEHGVAVASGRAGNVIGGGDWAADRIVPDAVGALADGRPIPVRNPVSVRPWQHVLEPLSGYLLLGARLAGVGTREPQAYCEGWNFGPAAEATRTVGELAAALVKGWGKGAWEDKSDPRAVHEAKLLTLNIEKARARLGWRPRWGFDETVARTVGWYRAQVGGMGPDELFALTLEQIAAYEAAG